MSEWSTVTVTVTGQCYECLLHNHIISDLQQRECMDRIIFMQVGVSPNIANPVKQLMMLHFRNARIIRSHIPIAWPSWSPDLNPCDFRLCDYLKDIIISTPIGHLLNWRHSLCKAFWTWFQNHCDELWRMLFLDSNFLQKTIDSMLSMFCISLAKF